jgi:hypothetical protein
MYYELEQGGRVTWPEMNSSPYAVCFDERGHRVMRPGINIRPYSVGFGEMLPAR